jgi:hypothetical protein
MMKISALAVAVLLIGAIVDGPAALAQTTGRQTAEPVLKGCQGTSRVQPQGRNKIRAVNPAN